MNAGTPSHVPTSLLLARRQLDQWRHKQSGRKRLPRELWAQAVVLAREHGINKTARILGLKYESLKKHLEAAPPGTSGPAEFIELVPQDMMPSSLECTVEWEEGDRGTLRMHVKGAHPVDLVSLARGLRDGRA